MRESDQFRAMPRGNPALAGYYLLGVRLISENGDTAWRSRRDTEWQARSVRPVEPGNPSPSSRPAEAATARLTAGDIASVVRATLTRIAEGRRAREQSLNAVRIPSDEHATAEQETVGRHLGRAAVGSALLAARSSQRQLERRGRSKSIHPSHTCRVRPSDLEVLR